MSLLHDRTFTATGLAHFSVDILNSQVGILLAFLSGPLTLSNALIGLISTLFSMSGSLTQPIVGWFSDLGIAEPYEVGGVLWMAGNFFSGLIADWWDLPRLGSNDMHRSGIGSQA